MGAPKCCAECAQPPRRAAFSALTSFHSYGPREAAASEGFSETGRLRCDFRYAAFARKTQHSPPGPRGSAERELAAALEAALRPSVLLDRFPKAQVDVFCLCLDSGCGEGGVDAPLMGGELAVATMAASLALAHAGVEMRDLVCACSVACASGGAGEEALLLLDPLASELPRAGGSLFVAAMTSYDAQTLQLTREVWSDPEVLLEARELALDACRSLDVGLREQLRLAQQG